MSVEKDKERGIRARAFVESDLVREFFKLSREDLFLFIQNSKLDESNKREDAYRMLKLIDKFEVHLTSIVENGKASELIMEEEKKKSLFQRFKVV